MSWNTYCDFKGDRLDDAGVKEAVGHVLRLDAEKKRDLVSLVHGQEVLERAELAGWLPDL